MRLLREIDSSTILSIERSDFTIDGTSVEIWKGQRAIVIGWAHAPVSPFTISLTQFWESHVRLSAGTAKDYMHARARWHGAAYISMYMYIHITHIYIVYIVYNGTDTYVGIHNKINSRKKPLVKYSHVDAFACCMTTWWIMRTRDCL